jgi:DNA-binding transcriptional regulator LsrR (DeoR family)
MVKVAQMYYIDGMKQEEIAGQLSISRSQISMILTEAKEAGIIEIKIRNPLINNDELACKFKNIFELEVCIIIPTAVQEAETLRKLVAQRAVEVVNREISNGSLIGIAWGRACYQFITFFRCDKEVKDVSVVSLIGGSNQIAGYYQVNEMVRLFAEKINGTPYFIHAPALTSSIEEKTLYMKSSSLQALADKWEAMDIVICGIGTLPSINEGEREAYIGESEIFKQLEKSQAIGDLCARYYNIKGEFIKDEYYDKVIGIPVESLEKAKKVICIASGPEKVNSILGALRTKTIDTFISDEQTAKAVIKNYS